jgi:hypothetical protein
MASRTTFHIRSTFSGAPAYAGVRVGLEKEFPQELEGVQLLIRR